MWDIFALARPALFSSRPGQPVRLTSGPLSYSNPALTLAGHKVLVFGTRGGGELVRYDLKSRQALSFFPGVCANDLAFSADGNWVLCQSPSERALVRVKLDGSARLTVAPISVAVNSCAWSPDGKQIVVAGVEPSGIYRIFLVSSEGSIPQELFPDNRNQDDPSWSPDGKLIAFARSVDSPASGAAPLAIQVLDLATRQLSLIPGSVGMRSPSWSPDRHFLAAVSDDGHKLMLLDLRTHKWTELAQAALLFGAPRWSGDGDSIYFQDILGTGEPVYRFRLCNRKKELLASFTDLLAGGVQRVAFRGFAPDGSLIASVDRNTADVYALDIDLP